MPFFEAQKQLKTFEIFKAFKSQKELELRGSGKGGFGSKREESVFANIMADGAEVIFETLKYQAKSKEQSFWAFFDARRTSKAPRGSAFAIVSPRPSIPSIR